MALDDAALARRCDEFMIDLSLAACELPSSHPWGHAILTPSIPLVWNANNLLLTDPELDADAIVALGDEVLGGAGLSHRSVDVLDSEAGQRLAPELEARGWESEPSVAMVLEGTPKAGAHEVEVTERRHAEIVDLRREL